MDFVEPNRMFKYSLAEIEKTIKEIEDMDRKGVDRSKMKKKAEHIAFMSGKLIRELDEFYGIK